MRTIRFTSIRELGEMGELVSVKLRRVQVHLARGLSEVIAKNELTPGSVSSLSLIAANPGISQLEVGQAIGVDRTTMVDILQDLENRGWVLRQKSDEDRRRYRLFATGAGQGALERIIQAVKRSEEEMLKGFPAEDLERLLSLVEEMRRVTVEAMEAAELSAIQATERQI